MGPGIPAHNINTWDGSGPLPRPIYRGYLPDPGTGSRRGSHVPMQDSQRIYPNWMAADHATTFYTPASLVGVVAEELGIK